MARRGNSKYNPVIILLSVLIVIALVLAGTLTLLIIKQNVLKEGNSVTETVSDNEGENGSTSQTGKNDKDKTGDEESAENADDKDANNTENAGNEGSYTAVDNSDRNAYVIEFANTYKTSSDKLNELTGKTFDFEFDLDYDGIAEKYRIAFETDKESGQTVINIEEGGETVSKAAIAGILESADSIDIVSIENNFGRGIAAICKTFDEDDNKYIIQCIVWEYVGDILTTQWNVVYTGRINSSNGYMKDGYIKGYIRDEQINYTTDTNMNGYILNRSTLMSDMKNLGIKLPKDTTGDCEIVYRHYANGIVRITVE